MKFKILLFSASALICASMISFFGTADVASDYTPREAMKQSNSLEGMELLYPKLRGNIETGKIESKDWHEVRNATKDHARQRGNNRALDLGWIEMGPDNIGGRTRALLVVDDQTIFAGAVTGGLWRSDNGGNTWYNIPSFPSAVIGSIAMTGNGHIYVGTGCDFRENGNGNGDSGAIGAGLFRSDDMGETWSVIDGTVPTYLNTSSNWNAINTLEGDPLDDNRVWVGADLGFGYFDESEGLVMNEQSGINPGQCQDIAISSDGSMMLVAMASARIYRSTDGGNNFENLSSSTDLPSSSGRARVSTSDLEPDKCFVLYSTSGGNMGGVWYTGNGGDNWNEVWPANIPEYTPIQNSQGIYDLALIQSAYDPELAFIGGVTFWKVTSQGQPEQAAFNFGFGDFDLYVHSDVHECRTAPNGDLYIGTDGGVFKSTDNGQTYFAANKDYNVTQFYGIGYSGGTPVIGGTQDNGSMVIFADDTYASEQTALDVFGGDGFDCDLSQVTYNDLSVAFVTSQNGVLGRFDNNGVGGNFYDEEIIDLMNDEGEIGGFYTCVRLFEDTQDENSEKEIILVNSEDFTIFDSVPGDDELVQVTAFTNNLNIPFQYTFQEDDTLHYWAELIRPAFSSPIKYEIDPNYFWLDAQAIGDSTIDCEIDSLAVDTVEVIDEIIEETVTVYWTDTIFINDMPIIVTDSTLVVVGVDTTYTDQINYDITETCSTMYHYVADTLEDVEGQMKITDPYTSMFTIGFNGGNGVWMTRDAMNFGTSPNWFRLGNAPGGTGTKAIEYVQGEHDETGDVMFLSGWDGSIWRISGLEDLWTDEDLLDVVDNDTGEEGPDGYPDVLSWERIFISSSVVVTGLGIDPNDPNHLVATIGGYGNVTGSLGQGHVMETWNALDDDPDWESLWFPGGGDMARMPCYDVVVDVSDETGQTLIVGTEFGIYTTDTGGGSNGEDWTQSNSPSDPNQSVGLSDAPCFSVRQQQLKSDEAWRAPINKGVIYAGTHGRGIFRSEDLGFTGIEDQDDLVDSTSDLGLMMYPNPASDIVNFDLDLNVATDININVFNLRGDLVQQIQKIRRGQGTHRMQLDVQALSTGTYIVQVDAGEASAVGKFIVIE